MVFTSEGEMEMDEWTVVVVSRSNNVAAAAGLPASCDGTESECI